MTEKTPLRTKATAQFYDELLVTLIQSGDRKAADQLAKRWHPRLLRTARRYANDAGLAEQLTQDCWLGIWRGIGGLRDPSRFAPWAFTILRNKGAKVIKFQIADRNRFEDADEKSVPARQEDSVALAQAFATLSPDQRLVAHLHFVEGLTIQEIAKVQDIPIGTTKSRLFHARQKLKTSLTSEADTELKGETA
ncbi:MAG: sigma-70 family RNA polymerase sigma factor [Altererythrobacter sp.]|nr:sigma-70 family RNA polymerase sigma factor [Altererythrobacter sp.]NNK45167.1 sigma-70 family RNA polymerase sigma factor [Altererythrobacter sp.]